MPFFCPHSGILCNRFQDCVTPASICARTAGGGEAISGRHAKAPRPNVRNPSTMRVMIVLGLNFRLSGCGVPNPFLQRSTSGRPLEWPAGRGGRFASQLSRATHPLEPEDVVIAGRREIENDIARLAQRHVGAGADVEAAADALAAGAARAAQRGVDSDQRGVD